MFEFGVKKSDFRISFSADTGAVTNDKPASAYFARYFFPIAVDFFKAREENRRSAAPGATLDPKTNDVLRFACSACRTSDRTRVA